MRLNKYLASQGLASRRGADTLIEQGAVKVNGEVAQMGMQVDPNIDTVEVDEKTLKSAEDAKVYYALYKPTGYVSSTKHTAMEDKNVLDCFPSTIIDTSRIFPVGRLDKESEGLLLMTNDGDLTYKLTHPSFEHEKQYEVEIFNFLTPEMMERLRESFIMLGQRTMPAEVKKLGDRKFSIILREGKNRQIRRMVRALGSGVRRLKRIRVSGYTIPSSLRPGEYIELQKDEVIDYFG